MAEMKDDIETLLSSIAALLDLDKQDALVPHGIGGHARELLARSVASIEALRVHRDSLRKALDDRYAADLKAARAIFAETGRTRGFPSVKDVVAFYMAEVERLECELAIWKERAEQFQRERAELFDKLNGKPCAEIRWQYERDALRDKLERAKEAIAALLACPEIADCDPRDKDTETENAERRARAVLAELSADKRLVPEKDSVNVHDSCKSQGENAK